MAVAATLGAGLENAAIALVAVWWPVYARLMRAQVIAVQGQDHVTAAVASGVGRVRLLTVYILPLRWTPTLINAPMDLGPVVLLPASLRLIGLGAVPPTPSCGAMISYAAVHFHSLCLAFATGVRVLRGVPGFKFSGP